MVAFNLVDQFDYVLGVGEIDLLLPGEVVAFKPTQEDAPIVGGSLADQFYNLLLDNRSDPVLGLG